MNVAIVGYGKMGKTIEGICKERGHNVVYIVDKTPNLKELKEAKADVAIEFTMPEVAYTNLKLLNEAAVSTVSGTTGWLDKYDEIVEICNQNDGAFIYGSNFSLGVNLFFALNEKLAHLINPYTNEYNVTIDEIHHTHKLDAPSGTAISLANGVLKHINSKDNWVLGDQKKDSDISITHQRIDPTPGTHTVSYQSEIDDIEIKHTAHTRKGFALGAVIAAEWLHDKKGVYTMKDVLGL